MSGSSFIQFRVFHIQQLTRNDLGMLYRMELLARKIIETIGHNIDGFQIGFHAKPSMHRLHLHVVSSDFHSPWMKSMKSWNSFNTPLFLSTEGWHFGKDSQLCASFLNYLFLVDVINQLKENGKVRELRDHIVRHFLHTPLKCNSCEKRVRDIPELKEHLARHFLSLRQRLF